MTNEQAIEEFSRKLIKSIDAKSAEFYKKYMDETRDKEKLELISKSVGVDEAGLIVILLTREVLNQEIERD